MTRRERMEKRLAKREEWADKRDQKAADAFGTAQGIAAGIPMGQPILVGHHSEKRHRRDVSRIDNAMRRGVESSHMAELHRSKAANIEAALDSSIFSDDADAVAALEARIAEREAERAAITAYNKSCRKGARDLSLLSEAQKKDLLGLVRVGMERPDGSFPAYVSTNLAGRIRADRERLKAVRAQQQRAAAAETAGGVAIQGSGDYVTVTFAEKPSREVLDALKAAGFWWSKGSWAGPAAQLPREAIRAEYPDLP